jgi:hydroxymethylpyrimidine/phosphomethylpyrimidine kinase
MNAPVALTIAGSDSSAGAGIQADLKTFGALGVYGLTAVTCVVAEIPGRVAQIDPVDSATVRKQIEVLRSAFPIRAIKTGLLCTGEIIRAVAESLDFARDEKIPIIVDPVMIATSGDRLLDSDAVTLYETELFPRASLITPNLDEASALLKTEVKMLAQMQEGAQTLAARFNTSVLIKGGHLVGNDAVDLLFHDGIASRFSAPRVAGVHTHGTGCTYSAAITAELAKGSKMEDAVAQAKNFVTVAIQNHFAWKTLHALNHSASRHDQCGDTTSG